MAVHLEVAGAATVKRDLVDEVDRATLDKMLAWAAAIPGASATFRVEHAAYGLFCATGYLGESAATLDDEGRLLFALDCTFWWWFDDLIDERMDAPQTQVAWAAVERALAGVAAASGPEGDAPEAIYVGRLSDALRSRSASPEEHAWWMEATRGTLGGFRAEEVVSRTREEISYAEQLEHGMWSATLVNVVAAASLLLRFGLGERHPAEPTALERLLCLTARLENDLVSVDRDLAQHCITNVAFVLARSFPAAAIPAFMADQRRGYERHLERGLDALGADHVFTKLARRILATHRALYATLPMRYAEPSAPRA